MSLLKRIVPGFLRRYLKRLRFPQLFGIMVVLLAINLAVPDPLPFLDEILMALAGAILGSLRKKVGAGDDPEISSPS